ncbi:MAG: NAD(P) transhydrogenase subunit alpha [Alphaproteobacteria bacterium]|nr:NAD(P) transhydrogenase subunit alpha [Alphaproteobacteria bacterium]
MIFQELIQHVKEINAKIMELVAQGQQLEDLSLKASQMAEQATQAGGESPFIMGLTVFVLAIFVGYYVVWKVTPALHSPLMAVTNAISSVIIVGALFSCGLAQFGLAKIFGFLGVILAAINIFGGFIVTQRMLGMFMKKK